MSNCNCKISKEFKSEVLEVIYELLYEIEGIGCVTGCDFGLEFATESKKFTFNDPITGVQKARDFCNKHNMDIEKFNTTNNSK